MSSQDCDRQDSSLLYYSRYYNSEQTSRNSEIEIETNNNNNINQLIVEQLSSLEAGLGGGKMFY